MYARHFYILRDFFDALVLHDYFVLLFWQHNFSDILTKWFLTFWPPLKLMRPYYSEKYVELIEHSTFLWRIRMRERCSHWSSIDRKTIEPDESLPGVEPSWGGPHWNAFWSNRVTGIDSKLSVSVSVSVLVDHLNMSEKQERWKCVWCRERRTSMFPNKSLIWSNSEQQIEKNKSVGFFLVWMGHLKAVRLRKDLSII